MRTLFPNADQATRSNLSAAGVFGELMDAFRHVRETTTRLTAPLSPEDCQVQSMPDASPVKWHLAHSTWFFETFILSALNPSYCAYSADFKVLFNSYYNAVGEKHPRAARGMLSRPPQSEVLEYRKHVDAAMANLAARMETDSHVDSLERATFTRMLTLGLQHEQQHQELILTDVKHMLSCNPLLPAYAPIENATVSSTFSDSGWTRFESGIYRIGYEGVGFAFDNESPAHDVLLQPYALANRPVTQSEYLAFMQDGGYSRPEFWLSAGWDTVSAQGWEAPMHWRKHQGIWQHFTLHGTQPLDLEAPVAHVSYFEADAYARWAGARLPREAEWECAARSLHDGAIRHGNFLENGHLAPTSATTDAEGLVQMFGDVWEWTCSSYDAYPGFSPPGGAVGEYNGKFMCNQYVLRGGSCATPRSHIRPTYRNFFPTDARWQFTGLRLARGI